MTTLYKESASALSLRVFKSQDINHDLVEIFKFFQASFPLDFINIPVMDDRRRVARYWAIVTKDNAVLWLKKPLKYQRSLPGGSWVSGRENRIN